MAQDQAWLHDWYDCLPDDELTLLRTDAVESSVREICAQILLERNGQNG